MQTIVRSLYVKGYSFSMNERATHKEQVRGDIKKPENSPEHLSGAVSFNFWLGSDLYINA